MRKSRVAKKIRKIATLSVATVGGIVGAGLLTYTLLSSAHVELPTTSYRDIRLPISNQQMVEMLPSSFQTHQLAHIHEIAMEDRGDAQKVGVDSSSEVTGQDVERLTEKALPYIAYELGIGRVNVPNIRLEKELGVGGAYYPLTNTVVLNSSVPLGFATMAITHELAHAQSLTYKDASLVDFIISAFPQRMRSEGNPHNETFASVLTLEVLANQALDGDVLARQVFFQRLDKSLAVRERKESGEKISGDEFWYYYKPAMAVVAALSGVKPEYGGIKLDAMVKLIRQETDKYSPVNK